MNREVRRLIRDYLALVRRDGIRVQEVRLFGSRARGKGRRWSDIDLCIVSPQFGKDYRSEGMRLRGIAAGLRVTYPIEPIPFHPKDLQDKYDTLASEIRKYGKKIRV